MQIFEKYKILKLSLPIENDLLFGHILIFFHIFGFALDTSPG